MGRKSAHTGLSPKDRSINLMDQFIKKNSTKSKNSPILPSRRKDPNVPIELWPFQDQIDYYENRTEADKFDDTYSNYADWFTEVRKQSKVYHSTFISFVADKKELMQSMYDKKVQPKEAVRELQKLGVY